ncbi:MAG: ROK family protein, partial [Solirubrobacteraceae bacterium]
MGTYGGIDLGGTKIQAVVVDEEHKVLGSARRPTPTTGGPADVARELAVAITDAAREAKIEPEQLDGIGVGSPGTIEDGSVLSARNLPDWEGSFPLASELQRAVGVS